MKSNFEFMDKTFPSLSNLGAMAESYLYSDRNICLIKLGLISENIVSMMMKLDGIKPAVTDNTHTSRTKLLKKEGLLPEKVDDILYVLQKARSNAMKNGHDSSVDCIILLEMACNLCGWFMQTYGDCRYVLKPFVLPEDFSRQADTKAKILEQELEVKRLNERLRQQPYQKTAMTMQRIKNGASAAERLRLSDKEIRYLIDEQLRKAGWEADSVRLCYTRGVQPEKGRNLAIAKWPNDFSFGRNNFADYVLCIGQKIVGIIEARHPGKDIPSVINCQFKGYARELREADTGTVIDTWNHACRLPFLSAINGCRYLKQLENNYCIWILDVGQSVNSTDARQGWLTPNAIMALQNQDNEGISPTIQNLPAGKINTGKHFTR